MMNERAKKLLATAAVWIRPPFEGVVMHCPHGAHSVVDYGGGRYSTSCPECRSDEEHVRKVRDFPGGTCG